MSQFNLRQIQELQAKMVKAQEELGKTNVEVTAGGGAINVFVHVEAQQPFRAAKEIPGQGLGRFGLADPCRPKQQQRSQRAPGIIEPGLECEEDIRKGLKHLRLAGEFVAENRENG